MFDMSAESPIADIVCIVQISVWSMLVYVMLQAQDASSWPQKDGTCHDRLMSVVEKCMNVQQLFDLILLLLSLQQLYVIFLTETNWFCCHDHELRIQALCVGFVPAGRYP